MSWYLLSTKPRAEFAVEMNLNMRGVQTYLPLTLTSKLTGRPQRQVPYFNRYVFFRMTPGVDNFYMVSKVPGVASIVKMTPDQKGIYNPTKVNDSLIEQLKASENERGILDVNHDYKQGDSVRIKSGAFHDIQAIVDAKTSDDRVIVLLNILGGQKRVELKYEQIEPAA